MSVNQIQGGAAFFGAAVQMATQSVQVAQPNTLQQIGGLLKSIGNFFQAAGDLAGKVGGFAQQSGFGAGFVPRPGAETMQPSMPVGFGGGFFGAGAGIGAAGGAAGGFFFGGVVGAGGVQQPSVPETKGGIEQIGPNKFKTPGGFTVEAEGKDAAWKITSPEGKETRVWGDPHVSVNGKQAFDFKDQSSFVLPDGTKITCHTKPVGNGPDAPTLSTKIDIMNGDQRASIDGIHTGKPESTGVKNDRWEVDAATKDGNYFAMGNNGDKWFLNGKNEITGGNARIGEIHTKGTTEAGAGGGVSDLAQNAMQEAPKFGNQEFFQNIMMNLMNMMMQQMMQQMFSGFTGRLFGGDQDQQNQEPKGLGAFI